MSRQLELEYVDGLPASLVLLNIQKTIYERCRLDAWTSKAQGRVGLSKGLREMLERPS